MDVRKSLLAALLALALLPLARQAAAAPDLGERLQACTACHGEQGAARRDGYVPRIAGKPAGYLEQQLLNFRDGRRPHRGMAYLLENLSDDYLREIAAHFAAQRPATVAAARQPALSALQAERARQLVQQGDAARRLPACAACHGAPLGGIQPGVPGLTGLPADYLIAQLGAWRSGKRRAREPDCMAQIAKQLPEAELAWVARWLAAQPPGEPLPTPPSRWPMDCGGVTR
jgi:cytochrome c553